MRFTTEDVTRLASGDLLDAQQSKIGRISEIYVDSTTRESEWILVHTGLFGTKETFVPIAQAQQVGNDLCVPYSKDFVKDAPSVEADGELSDAEEAELERYYAGSSGYVGGTDWDTTSGWDSSSETRPDTDRDLIGTRSDIDSDIDRDIDTDIDTDIDRDTSRRTTETSMTRSEEELDVQRRRRPSELVRIKKHIVTENQTITVPVQREEVRIEREAITDANIGDAMSGRELSDDERELTLSSEEIVVEKRVVPKERVRLEKDVVTEERTINEQLRKEEIDVERDGRTDGLASDRSDDSLRNR